MFNILCLDTKLLVEDESGTLSFEQGDWAAKVAKSLTEQTGKRHQPRKAGDCADWRAREQARVDSGEYTVPQCLAGLLKSDHYAHVSKDKPAMLSYTKDEAKGRADLQTRIPVKAYLATFCDIAEDSASSIDLCAAYADECVPSELLFARTPDEIETVYINFDNDCNQVSGSCMRYERNHWESGIHPCRVYGAGDLAIAYLANERGETTDRALVWPEKLIYSRVYGETDRLHVLLKNAGYRKSAYYAQYDRYGNKGSLPTFVGAKLLKLLGDPEGNDDDCFVMPYIDEDVRAEISGKFMVIATHGDYSASETSGRTCDPEDSDRAYCENCEESCDSDETYEVHTRDYGRGMQIWCSGCVERNAFRCEGSGDLYSDSCTSYTLESGHVWSAAYFDDHGGTCERTDTHHRSRNLSTVIVDDRGSEEAWCRDAIDEDAWTCERTGKLYSNDVQSVTVTVKGVDKVWSQAAVNEFGDECDEPIDETRRLLPAELLTVAERAQLCTLKGTSEAQTDIITWLDTHSNQLDLRYTTHGEPDKCRQPMRLA